MRVIILICALLFTIQAADASPRHRGHHSLPWCGIWLSQHLHKTDRRLALAREWATEGHPAGGPGVGVIVVWPHHVGIITGRTESGEWIVLSGNDGGRVRERPRSVSGAIAFRTV